MSLVEKIYKLYWEDKLSQREIGKIYNKSREWVRDQMKKYKIPTKNEIDILDRFLYHVRIPNNSNSCWDWVGCKNLQGYGQFGFNGKMEAAHRVSYMFYIGEFDPTLCCLHKCDNPSCVNPHHLFIGTHEDNMNDKKQKGRVPKGETHSNSKLIMNDVKKIKALLLQGISQIEIARLFKISQSTISNIKRGRTWKCMKENEKGDDNIALVFI